MGSELRDRLDENLFSGKAYLKGMGGEDELIGSALGDVLDGGAGNDRLYGNDDDDQLDGDAGDDVIEGGHGSDTVDGGDGNDALYGLSKTISQLSVVQLSVAPRDRDTIDGANGNDTLEGGLGNDLLNGGNGKDVLDERPAMTILREDVTSTRTFSLEERGATHSCDGQFRRDLEPMSPWIESTVSFSPLVSNF